MPPSGLGTGPRDTAAAAERLRARFGRHHGSIADRVKSALVEAIEDGSVAAGARLGEEPLAGVFGVSRTPVREALLRLENENLAERDRRGALRVAGISAQQIIELYVVREALDGAAARLAASNVQPLELKQLAGLNDAMRAAGTEGRFDEMADLNVKFHDLLARSSRNEMLEQFMAQIHGFVRRFRTTTFSYPDRALTAVAEHDELLAAIGAGDEEAAERVARAHMRRALDVRIALEARNSSES